jgi:adenylate kinase
MRLILLGAPGVGKGTQGALLSKKHDLTQISTGDILRDAVRRDTPLGQKANGYMQAGELVPDALILELVREVLKARDDAFILDGFPRTLDQAEGLSAIMAAAGIELDAVVVLRAPDDVLVKRISGRRSCPKCKAVYNVYFEAPAEAGRCDRCGAELVRRADDDAATVENRLSVYRRQTQPLIDFYEASPTRVIYVDGTKDVVEVQAEIEEKLPPA